MSAIEDLDAIIASARHARSLLLPSTPYNALTDRDTRPKPTPLPALGPAGSSHLDPVFGGLVWRATDDRTSGGRALRVASNTSLASWNANGSVFFVMNEGGAALFFAFDPQTGPTPLPTAITLQIEPSFSYVYTSFIFGVVHHTIMQWSIITGAATPILDLDTLGLNLGADTYVGGLVTADKDDYVVFFGGTGQDQHFYVRHSSGALLDTRPLGFKVHSAILERNGPMVIIYPAVDPQTGRMPLGIAQIQLWNTVTHAVTPVTIAAGGHASVGYGDFINADIVPGTGWDPMQWVTRKLATPDQVTNLISPLLPPRTYPVGGCADHQNYRHAKSGDTVPIISATYRYGGYAGPWRAWDDEIIGIAADGTVYRFAHHYSVATSFWDQPIIAVRPQGDWCIGTTNWGQTLNGRQDVCVWQLR